MDLVSRKGFLNVFWALLFLAGVASQARAATIFGVCVLPAVQTQLGTSSADYSNTTGVSGCNGGFTTSLQPGAVLTPASLPSGLTTASLTLTQPMTSGGTAVATAAASLDQGALHLYGDSQGTLIGCGGSCMTTGGSAFPQAYIEDTLHYTISDAAPSAIGTFHAHLDGVIGLESGFGNYGISETFLFGGASGCWQSDTGTGFQPCGAQNYGWLTSSFTNQTASGFDFTGTFNITNGMSGLFLAGLQMNCGGGALCDFSNTASFSLTLPSDVTFSSDSGVLFSQQASSVPEPATFICAGAALTLLGVLRRRKKAPEAHW
jgi:hypothetical protein